MKNIKRVLFCSFLSLLCTTLLMAKGVTQAGKTYLYDYKTKTKRPIANVKLTVADAEPTFSGADGSFTLKFTGREMGDKIAHSQLPYYQGLKVFNKTEFENWFIRKEPLRLIMCNKDEAKVKSFHEGLKLASIEHFFDRSYLKIGDIFPQVIQDYINSADLFVLFWSKNASKSDYVDKERKQALKGAFPKVKPQQAAKLSIYPMSIEPRAELPGDMKNNYHFGEI